MVHFYHFMSNTMGFRLVLVNATFPLTMGTQVTISRSQIIQQKRSLLESSCEYFREHLSKSSMKRYRRLNSRKQGRKSHRKVTTISTNHAVSTSLWAKKGILPDHSEPTVPLQPTTMLYTVFGPTMYKEFQMCRFMMRSRGTVSCSQRLA